MLLSLPLALYKGRIYPRLGSGGIFPFPAKSHMVCVLCIISLKWFPSLATRSLTPARKLRPTRFPSRFHHARNYHGSSKSTCTRSSCLVLKLKRHNMGWSTESMAFFPYLTPIHNDVSEVKGMTITHKVHVFYYWSVLHFRTRVCYVICAQPSQASCFKLLSSWIQNTAHSFTSSSVVISIQEHFRSYHSLTNKVMLNKVIKSINFCLRSYLTNTCSFLWTP
jgi:hypothetical protein